MTKTEHIQLINKSIDFLEHKLDELHKQLDAIESAKSVEGYSIAKEILIKRVEHILAKLAFEKREVNRLYDTKTQI